MKFALPAIICTIAVSTAESLSLRGVLGKDEANVDAAASSAIVDGATSADQQQDGRELQWIADCATVAYWHPVYTVGWENGYCSETTGCNAPSYLTAADCCGSAYLRQSTRACEIAAGISPPPPPTPPSPSPPTPGATQWYPDYGAQWAVGKCIDTLPLPPYGSRPLYDTQLECCKMAYAGQTNNYCIQNLANPPTSSPSVSPTSTPTSVPTTSKPTGTPTETPTGAPSISPTQKPTGTPTETPTGAPSVSPTQKPTGVPTESPTSKPTGVPSEAPTKAPTGEPTTKTPTASPTTAGPTVTQYGSLWYPNYNLSKCSNKLPLPVNGAAPTSNSKEECCAGNYNWRYTECINVSG